MVTDDRFSSDSTKALRFHIEEKSSGIPNGSRLDRMQEVGDKLVRPYAAGMVVEMADNHQLIRLR